MKNYVMVGAGGFVAPKHMQAIKETGGTLLAIHDPHDSIGVIDSYFPSCLYFKDLSRFERYCYKNDSKIDYLVICSPNYTHDTWCRFGLSHGFDVICEKPLVLTEHNWVQLMQAEQASKNNINTILQLRLAEPIIQLKETLIKVKVKQPEKKFFLDVTYNTPRGNWYDYSWKSDIEQGGGLAINVGVHLFDIMFWLFDATHYRIVALDKRERQVIGVVQLYAETLGGTIEVGLGKFDLSIQPGTPCRKLFVPDVGLVNINHEFNNLHTKSYDKIIKGEGFDIHDTRLAIAIGEEIRNAS